MFDIGFIDLPDQRYDSYAGARQDHTRRAGHERTAAQETSHALPAAAALAAFLCHACLGEPHFQPAVGVVMLNNTASPTPPRQGVYARLMAACAALSALLFGALGLLVFLDVLLRNLGIVNLPWGLEVSEYLLMSAAFAAAPWLLYHGDHIRVDILVRALPVGAQRVLDALSNLFGLAVCAVLAWEAAGSARDAALQGALTYKVLVFPEWWLTTPMIASFVLMTVEFARRLVRPSVAGAR